MKDVNFCVTKFLNEGWSGQKFNFQILPATKCTENVSCAT